MPVLELQRLAAVQMQLLALYPHFTPATQYVRFAPYRLVRVNADAPQGFSLSPQLLGRGESWAKHRRGAVRASSGAP